MIPIAVEELEALGLGELHGSGEITGLQIDSRRVGPGDLFVAIRGGREFVGEARDRGAATLVPNDEFAAMAVIGQALRAPQPRPLRRRHRLDRQDLDEGHPRRALRARRADRLRRRGATTPSSACR